MSIDGILYINNAFCNPSDARITAQQLVCGHETRCLDSSTRLVDIPDVAMIALDPGQIHLWFVFGDEIKDESLLQHYRDMLAEDELVREQRFHFPKDRRRYLLTRALVRSTLSRYVAIAPSQWRFSVDSYGKPAITNEEAVIRKISFNISHTRGLIVLGITCGRALGVDVENIRSGQAPLDVVNHYFSPAEAADLLALPSASGHDRFFQYWTLKESYIKARGMGLSIPLDQFEFSFVQRYGIELSIDPRLNDDPARWRFWQFQPSADYIAAVCAETETSTNQRLVMKRIVPLREEELLGCALILESQ